nr:MAG TPA_asm: Head to tail joining protein [Caudoviricetes sp.]
MATPQQLLQDAERAYHALQTGASPRVIVDVDGSRTEFAPANLSKLYSYIQDLKAQVGVAGGAAPQILGPATFIF